MMDLFEHWIHHIPIYDRHITRFARWLKKPVAESIRLQGLIWLKEVVEKDKNYRLLEEKSLTENLASLLNIIWDSNRTQLYQEPSFFETFKYLLYLLTERQNKIALELAKIITG